MCTLPPSLQQYIIEKINLWTGEMAQQLRVLSVSQRTRVQFLAPHGSSQPSMTLVPEDPASSSGLQRYQTHM